MALQIRILKQNNMKEITKEQMIEAMEKYPPSNYVTTLYRIFGKYSEHPIKKWFIRIEVALFGLGFLFTALGLNHTIVGIPTILFSLILVVVVLSLTVAYVMNRIRLRKAYKYLGISAEEWNLYVMMYDLNEGV